MRVQDEERFKINNGAENINKIYRGTKYGQVNKNLWKTYRL